MKRYWPLVLVAFIGCAKHDSSSAAAPVNNPVAPTCGTTMVSASGTVLSGGQTGVIISKFNPANGDTIAVYSKKLADTNWVLIPNGVACSASPQGVAYEILGIPPTMQLTVFGCSGQTMDWMYQATVHACS